MEEGYFYNDLNDDYFLNDDFGSSDEMSLPTCLFPDSPQELTEPNQTQSSPNSEPTNQHLADNEHLDVNHNNQLNGETVNASQNSADKESLDKKPLPDPPTNETNSGPIFKEMLFRDICLIRDRSHSVLEKSIQNACIALNIDLERDPPAINDDNKAFPYNEFVVSGSLSFQQTQQTQNVVECALKQILGIYVSMDLLRMMVKVMITLFHIEFKLDREPSRKKEKIWKEILDNSHIFLPLFEIREVRRIITAIAILYQYKTQPKKRSENITTLSLIYSQYLT